MGELLLTSRQSVCLNSAIICPFCPLLCRLVVLGTIYSKNVKIALETNNVAKTLLRSGCLDDFLALGENGQSVFDSALQIRETLRLRRQQIVADCLAIPQLNDDGDRVDWYAAFPGRVTSWNAASNEQRKQALKVLEKCVDNAHTLSQRCLQSDKTAIQLFGALLSKAIQFPGPNHLFLVDDKPVITFWGFIQLNEDTREDVLACLYYQEPPAPVIQAEPETEPEPVPVAVELTQPDEPLLYSAPKVMPVVKETIPVPDMPPASEPPSAPVAAAPVSRRKKSALWLLPVAAAVAAAVVAPMLWHMTSAPPAPEPVLTAAKREAALPSLEVTPVSALPLSHAEVIAPPPVQAEPPAPPKLVEPPKNALMMPVTDVRMGTTAFLDGTWRVAVSGNTPAGSDPVLRYQIKKNKGTAHITREKNVVCKADIYSGLLDTGQLMIKSRSVAKCSDGSRYPLPEIACKQGDNGAAVCTARYDDKTEAPVTLRKASK